MVVAALAVAGRRTVEGSRRRWRWRVGAAGDDRAWIAVTVGVRADGCRRYSGPPVSRAPSAARHSVRLPS
jgi:hypothetical protein